MKKISVIMPSLNSSSTLKMSLDSIRTQSYSIKDIEILLIDGGSTDDTKKIAKKYGCRIIRNPHVQQEYAKFLGLKYANGEIAIFLDTDEVLGSRDAIKNRVEVFNSNNNIKIVLFGGYKSPINSSGINEYINCIADPFAYFIYGFSSASDLMLKSWKNKIKSYIEFNKYVEFDLSSNEIIPLVDMCAGNAIDLTYFRNTHLKGKNVKENIVPNIFYIIINDKQSRVAVLRSDFTVHYSAENIKKYLRKLKWRTIVNVHYKSIPGTGFSNREKYQPQSMNFKKYLFIPYAFLFVPALLVGIHFALMRKKIIFLLNPFIAIYLACNILYQYLLKVLSISPNLSIYGK